MTDLYDPNYHLDELGKIKATMDRVKDSLYGHVYQARLGGATWQEIADKLGVTRQAVHTRWAKRIH